MLDLGLQLVQQTTDSNCWAASTAMLVGYRDSQSVPDTSIVDQMSQADPANDYHHGATQPELANVARVFNLVQVYPVCQDATGWQQWLNDHGPLLIQVPGNAYHSIVISGVDPDNGAVRVLDPWPPGSGLDSWQSFEDLNSNYEIAGTTWNNNVYAVK